PRSTLFPYTTLFRSPGAGQSAVRRVAGVLSVVLSILPGRGGDCRVSRGNRSGARMGNVASHSAPDVPGVCVLPDLRGAIGRDVGRSAINPGRNARIRGKPGCAAYSWHLRRRRPEAV